jgi:hypothetical protein
VFEGEGEPVLGDVRDVDFAGTEGAGRLGGDDADGPGACDQDPAAGFDFRPLASPKTDRERLDERGRLVADAVRNVVGEVALDGDVFGEGAVDRWRGLELDVRAQVIAAGLALFAGAAGALGFDGDAVADAGGVNGASDGGDPAGEFVAQDQWVVNHVVADPAMFVVVNVAAADADCGHLHQDLIGVELRNREGFQGHVPLALQDGGSHGGRQLWPSEGRELCG